MRKTRAKTLTCPEPGCERTFDWPPALAGHRRSHNHGLAVKKPAAGPKQKKGDGDAPADSKTPLPGPTGRSGGSSSSLSDQAVPEAFRAKIAELRDQAADCNARADKIEKLLEEVEGLFREGLQA